MMRLSRRAMFIVLICCATGIVLFVEPLLEDDSVDVARNFSDLPVVSVNTRRVVHVDFKGAPPKITYVRRLLTLLAAAGGDTLLFEYEDMFPYGGRLANLSAGNGYSAHQIRDLLTWCHDLGFEVIPLVQTFGHLEYALKLAEWSHLREVEESPQAICPTRPGSDEFIRDLLKQVMAMHGESRFIHIGSDEVFHLGLCPSCSKAYGFDRRKIYEDHVVKVATFLKESHPHVTVLIWDDMIRQWKPQDLQNSPLVQLVTPVVWDYTSNVPTNLFPAAWWWYTQLFPKVWIASAYKGAELPDSALPDVNARIRNQESWFELLTKAQNRGWTTRIEGVVLTGWSRYDHFAELCELLPASLPSLILSLLTVGDMTLGERTRSRRAFNAKWRQILSCPPDRGELTQDTVFDFCDFPGVDAYLAMVSYRKLSKKVESLWSSNHRRGWLTSYNVRHNFTSPYIAGRILTTSDGLWSLKEELLQFKSRVKPVLGQYVDEYSVLEWVDQRVTPLEVTLARIEHSVKAALTLGKTWRRRPLAG